jgi:hypothetical protein
LFKTKQTWPACRKTEAKEGTMKTQEHGSDDEELTARMFFKLASAASQKTDRRVRPHERDGFNEFHTFHNRQKDTGGGRDSGQ